jgi:DNA-directed RNA polymerase specialized sigma subunit
MRNTTKQKQIIRLFKKGKLSKYAIGKKVGVSRTYVYLILKEANLI